MKKINFQFAFVYLTFSVVMLWGLTTFFFMEEKAAEIGTHSSLFEQVWTLLPLIGIPVTYFLSSIYYIHSMDKNTEQTKEEIKKIVDKIIYASSLFFPGCQYLLIYSLINDEEISSLAPTLFTGAYMVFLGFLMADHKEWAQKFTIKTRHTLASQNNAESTLQFTTKLMKILGVLLIFLSILSPSFLILVASCMLIYIGTVIYSYYLANKEKAKAPPEESPGINSVEMV